jgi:hypothetical protein
MITKYWILKNIYFNKAIKQSHYVNILIPITFLQLEFQKSTLWTLCNITHKISSNILERMGGDQPNISGDTILTLNVSYSTTLTTIFNGLI